MIDFSLSLFLNKQFMTKRLYAKLSSEFYFDLKFTPLILLLFFHFSFRQNTVLNSLYNLLSKEKQDK
jgi:hypothetical protein